MEAQASQDGRMRFTLGSVERWIVAAGATVITAVIGWFAVTVLQTRDAIGDLTRQQTVVAERLSDIKTQLADVPAIKLELAKQAVQVEQNKQDIRELKQLRGLK